MRAFTIPALLASALFSVVVVIPFLPAAKPNPRPFVFEFRAASTVSGAVQVYYDIGHGYREADSAELPLTKSDVPQPYRFPLPAGTYRSIRLDPADRPGTVTLESDLRITSQHGRLIRSIPPAAVQALEQIESLRPAAGRLEIVTTSTAKDPQLALTFSSPLRLGVSVRDVAADILPRSIGIFAALALLLLGWDRTPRVRARANAATGWFAQHPFRAVAMVAAVAVVASAYPVVFLGKSHVSPNFGTTLLYEAYPTLPGYTSTRTADGNGADVGAAMWAHLPYAFVQRRALASGELPLWNRYNSAGTPLLAQGQTMFGDPLHGIVLAAGGASWAWDVKYLVAKWLFAFALGLSVLAILRPMEPLALRDGIAAPQIRDGAAPPLRNSSATQRGRRSSPLPAALMVAFAAPFIGFFVYRINHPAIFSLCYAPWVLYCWMRVAQAAGRRPAAVWIAALCGANVALFNSGTVKEAYLLLLQMNAAGALFLVTASIPGRERLAKLIGATIAGGLVILMMAPVWDPFLQTLRNAYTAYSHPVAFQIQPSLLLGAFDELFFRPLSQGEIVFNPALNILLLLGLLYLLATPRLHVRNRGVLALGACAALALAFVFGVIPPHGIARVPLLANVAHIENCFLAGFIVLGSILAGVGFATAARRLGTREGRADLVIAGLLGLTMVCAWIGFRQASHRMVFGPGTTLTVIPANEVIAVSPFIWGSLAALLLASLVLALVAQHAFTRNTLGAGGAILAVLGVSVLLWRQGMHASAIGFEKYVVRPPVRAPFDGPSAAVERVQTGIKTEPGRVFGLHGNLTPGWNAAYGLENIHGPDALQNRWLRELIDASPLKWNSSWRLYCTSRDVGAAQPFLDALNVRYYLDRASDQKVLTRTLTLAGSADLDVYESRTAWPRAFFTNRVDTYQNPAELMTKILTANQPPFAAVQQQELASHPGLVPLSRDGVTPTVTPAIDYALTENTTTFRARTGEPGIVVLTEAWWPDSFRVKVDGQRRPVVRVNHAFKGVVIDSAGDHVVTFSYWPRKFFRSLMLSGSAALVLLAGLAFALRPARHA